MWRVRVVEAATILRLVGTKIHLQITSVCALDGEEDENDNYGGNDSGGRTRRRANRGVYDLPKDLGNIRVDGHEEETLTTKNNED